MNHSQCSSIMKKKAQSPTPCWLLRGWAWVVHCCCGHSRVQHVVEDNGTVDSLGQFLPCLSSGSEYDDHKYSNGDNTSCCSGKCSCKNQGLVLPQCQVAAGQENALVHGLESSSLVPRPPFNTARGKGGLVNIVQHFCTSAEFRGRRVSLTGNETKNLRTLRCPIRPKQTTWCHNDIHDTISLRMIRYPDYNRHITGWSYYWYFIQTVTDITGWSYLILLISRL